MIGHPWLAKQHGPVSVEHCQSDILPFSGHCQLCTQPIKPRSDVKYKYKDAVKKTQGFGCSRRNMWAG